MSNDFFNASGTPTQGGSVASPGMRGEFSAVAAGFDKLPALTGNANKLVRINASGTAMDVATEGTDYTNLAVLSAATAAVPNDTDLIAVVDAGVTKKLPLAKVGFSAGTKMPFAQAAAPTGWTQVVDDTADNRMLRVVKTAGAGTAGTHSPILNDKVASHTHGFTTGYENANHYHAGPSHSHGVTDPTHSHTISVPMGGGSTTADPTYAMGATLGPYAYQYANAAATGISIDAAGTGNTGIENTVHAHLGTTDPNTGPVNWSPRYIDMIICSKD